jgi:hypothetical protein
MTFKLRKLCSSMEEYEANECGPLDLDQYALLLSHRPGVEHSRCGSILTVLFENEGVVVRLFSNGRALIQAGFREDAERICSILTEVSSSIVGQAEGPRSRYP